MHPPTPPKQAHAFLGLVGYYRKFIKNFTKITKPLTLLRREVKFEWTPEHHEAFMKLKDSIIKAPILCYPNPNKRCIVYTDTSDDSCGAQLTQEHDDTEFPIAFLSHTFLENQRKWSTTEQEAYGVYYTVTKWNDYHQGADSTVQNDHKPLTKFSNGKIANNKVNRWGLELAIYNITFEWISGAKNKAADFLSHLVELPPTTSTMINMLSVSNTDGPAFYSRSQTQQYLVPEPFTAQPSITPDIMSTPDLMPKSLTADRLAALLQVQKTDPFCKQISK